MAHGQLVSITLHVEPIKNIGSVEGVDLFMLSPLTYLY
jgi:hypothetical protein